MSGVIISTTWGEFTVHFSPQGLRRLHLIPIYGASRKKPPLAEMLEKMLNCYLEGEAVDFSPIPLDFSGASAFQLRVWLETIQIPYGQTITYGELSRKIGLSWGARAVGQALKRNPVPIIIPCHRVVGRGRLGGYSEGIEWKRRLINLESVG